MRLATWNLKSCPAPQSARGHHIGEILSTVKSDITLLTEVHADWVMEGGHAVKISPNRPGYKRQQRLAGVQSTFVLEQLEGSNDHPGEEAHGPDIIPTVAIAVLLAVGVPLLLVTKRLPNRLAT